jgi:hypothetical protein
MICGRPFQIFHYSDPLLPESLANGTPTELSPSKLDQQPRRSLNLPSGAS